MKNNSTQVLIESSLEFTSFCSNSYCNIYYIGYRVSRKSISTLNGFLRQTKNIKTRQDSKTCLVSIIEKLFDFRDDNFRV